MKINCECGAKLTEDEKEHNEEVARETGTKRLDMCSRCWGDYCEHAITGN